MKSAVAFFAVTLTAYSLPAAPPATGIDPARLAAFQALPAAMESRKNPITEDKVRLGRMLYYETRLSRNQELSCNSCHMLDKFGVDHERFSTGFKAQKGNRNSPTVYNAAGQVAQFWDGRAADVEEQAKGPVLNPVEMALPNDQSAVAVLKSMPEYVAAFRKAFPGQAGPVTFDNMAKAIGAFERKLVTPSRWDKYLKGDKTALTAQEQAGFNKFVDTGCQACHMGAYVGGQMFQKLGLVKPYPDQTDPGRFAVTKQESDRMMFKVPTLRNVEMTAPYFHNGSSPALEDAVRKMAEYQLGRKLTDSDVKLIVTWLKALTGAVPADYIKPPALPKSTARTVIRR